MVFRTTSFACPGCNEALAADAAIAWCQGCKGVWVSEAELEERVRIVRGKNEFNLELVLEPARSASHVPARRPCPLCREPLGHVRMGKAEVDRCGRKHGIWFDADELESVLQAATQGVGVKVPRVKATREEDVRGGLPGHAGPVERADEHRGRREFRGPRRVHPGRHPAPHLPALRAGSGF